LVEDDASVRELCRSVLRKEGFEVLVAAEPQEALELYLKATERCDLVITDVVMPGMSGPDLVEALRRLEPDLPALFVSGYAPEEVVGEGLSGAFLPKPFRPTELLRKVSAMLYGLDSQVPPPGSVRGREGDFIPASPTIPSDVPTFTTEPPLSGAKKRQTTGSSTTSVGSTTSVAGSDGLGNKVR
jgi:DNA-binding response OmpR family regulator